MLKITGTAKKDASLKTFAGACEYLESFMNYEQKPSYSCKGSFKLARVRKLFGVLNIKYKQLKVLHIAGTKGKGSAAAFCANILAASGKKTGLYTSPHLNDFRERIKILHSGQRKPGGGVRIKEYLIPEKSVAGIVGEMKPALEKLKKDKKYGAPTFFEVYTAIAVKYFLDEKVDYAVIETGLGGRLDATNILNTVVSIITHIGYDHMDKLGATIEEIAREKAGIIKSKTPVICSAQAKSVERIIKKRCLDKKSPLYILGKNFSAGKVEIHKNFTIFDFCFANTALKRLKIFLKGRCQVENASCSLAALITLGKAGNSGQGFNLRRGIGVTFLEGRFQVLRKSPLTVIDVAHNVSSFAALKENLKAYFPSKKIILVFAAAQDKDIKGMLEDFPYDKIILTSFPGPRAFSPGDIKNICRLNSNVCITENIKQAILAAKEAYSPGALILIAGSFFLAAEAKSVISKMRV